MFIASPPSSRPSVRGAVRTRTPRREALTGLPPALPSSKRINRAGASPSRGGRLSPMTSPRPMTVDEAEELAAAQLKRRIEALLDRVPQLDREEQIAA